eukprot:GHVQ01022756.1.p2 GENE.GHVQ01022756.1~~GHVQ01022756.1.p2  ORF type:complete len:197 (-),score=39.85 GHVQ01022756.1:2587-3177(-)
MDVTASSSVLAATNRASCEDDSAVSSTLAGCNKTAVGCGDTVEKATVSECLFIVEFPELDDPRVLAELVRIHQQYVQFQRSTSYGGEGTDEDQGLCRREEEEQQQDFIVFRNMDSDRPVAELCGGLYVFFGRHQKSVGTNVLFKFKANSDKDNVCYYDRTDCAVSVQGTARRVIVFESDKTHSLRPFTESLCDYMS